jgi:hypothetical protein
VVGGAVGGTVVGGAVGATVVGGGGGRVVVVVASVVVAASVVVGAVVSRDEGGELATDVVAHPVSRAAPATTQLIVEIRMSHAR